MSLGKKEQQLMLMLVFLIVITIADLLLTF